MDIDYFARLWSEGTASRTSGKSFWDNRAAEFNKLVSQHGPDERIRKIIGFLSQLNLKGTPPVKLKLKHLDFCDESYRRHEK